MGAAHYENKAQTLNYSVRTALLIAIAAEFYVTREFLCALFTVFGLLLFLILVVEESSRELLHWVGAHIHVGHM